MSTAVAFIVKGYPRLSETFIAQEIRALERRGLEIRLFSLRLPTDPATHPIHGEIRASVVYLPEYLRTEPRRVLTAWRAVRRSAGYRQAFAAWLRDLARDRTPNRIRRFGQALVLANELGDDVGWLHAHFLHTPASVARYAAMIRSLPWSVSAHAKDVWTIPDWEIREKLQDCRWAVTCSAVNARRLGPLAPGADRVTLVYHGLDLARFPPPRRARPPRTGTDAEDPVIILSVGRLVEKKGYDVLIDALGRLPSVLHWRLVHIGGGPLLETLKARARRAGIADRIRWLGPLPQDEVLARYRAADLFVLAMRIARDGDRDGLPNALMEAQSQGLACVASRLSAAPELIDDGETGLLVPAEDADALARALGRVIQSPALRQRLGSAAMRRIHAAFAMDAGIDRLALLFGLVEDRPPACASPSTPP